MQEPFIEPQHSNSSQFEVLLPEEMPPAPIFDLKALRSLLQTQTSQKDTAQEQQECKMGVVVQDQTYVVLEPVAKNGCNQQQWKELISRKQKQFARLILGNQNKQQQNLSSHGSRLSCCQRLTLLGIKTHDKTKRLQLWEIANYAETVQQEYIEMEQFEVQNCQSRREELANQLPPHQIESLRKAVFKISRIFHKIIELNLSSAGLPQVWKTHLMALRANDQHIMSWFRRILQRCALDFKQIRYCKGLQYICLGIVISYPEVNLPKYSQIFYHFLQQNNYWELYLDSSPRYYSQLQKICQSLKEDLPDIYSQIIAKKGDYKNLFITYFRSCLLYRLTNPELIRKLFELLFVEGMAVVKTVVLRALTLLEPHLMLSQHFLEHVASFVIQEYFGKVGCQHQEVAQRFIQLFQI